MALTDEEKEEIGKELEHYLRPQAAGLAALRVVQKSRGWVEDTLPEVAALLGMTDTELEGIATFFDHIHLRPPGRHVIHVCDSISCWVMGYDPLRRHLEGRLGTGLGGTTADGRFTLLPIACLGICHEAPAMLVDGALYTKLDPVKIDEILNKHE